MTSQGSDRLDSDRPGSDRHRGRGPAQPLADPAANNEDEYAETGTVADTTGRGLRPRSADPETGRGTDTGPHTGDQGVSPNRNTAGRSGADTGAGSHPKIGMEDADLDPATGGLGDTGTAGSASPSRSRTRTAVYSTDTEPFAGGAARGKKE
ncbi:MAG: hypothetical protein AB7O13_21020 [Alphaproteobacteria bacterium]